MIETYYEELAHEIMGPEKSHSLLSASFRPRKAKPVVLNITICSQGLRTRRAGEANPSPRAEEKMRCPRSSNKAERERERKREFSLYLLL